MCSNTVDLHAYKVNVKNCFLFLYHLLSSLPYPQKQPQPQQQQRGNEGWVKSELWSLTYWTQTLAIVIIGRVRSNVCRRVCSNMYEILPAIFFSNFTPRIKTNFAPSFFHDIFRVLIAKVSCLATKRTKIIWDVILKRRQRMSNPSISKRQDQTNSPNESINPRETSFPLSKFTFV